MWVVTEDSAWPGHYKIYLRSVIVVFLVRQEARKGLLLWEVEGPC